jgi:diguanylate cyclase (GGDEF)-like protein
MAAPFRISGNPEKSLNRLLSEAELKGFGLALYDADWKLLAARGPQTALCGSPSNLLCKPSCLETRGRKITEQDNPSLLLIACRAGLWHYLIPCRTDDDERCILIAGGVRGYEINLPYLEDLAAEKDLPAESLLEIWSQLPALSKEKMLAAGDALRRILAEQEIRKPPSLPQEHTTGLIKSLAKAETLLENATTPEAIVNAVNDALAPVFAPRRVALFLPKDGSDELHWLFPAGGTDTDGLQAEADGRQHGDGGPISCLPLQVNDELLGCLVLFVNPPCSSDLLLLKILAGRVAIRLQQVNGATDPEKSTGNPAEILLNRLKTLTSINDCGTLCQQILDTAAGLVDAAKGSLMLFDDAAGRLHLRASLGMNHAMAEELNLRADQGIVGLVVRSGQPLLVQDMEKDQRISIAPRPRYRTRSLLCLPMRTNEGLLGVLNLADKKDDSAFTEADQISLTSLIEHCTPLIERLTSRQRLQKTRQEAALDPETGAYNHLLLERRFGEEASRCARSRRSMALLMIAHDTPEEGGENRPKPDDAMPLLASLLKDLLRRMDIVGRVGTNRFAVLLAEISRETALAIAERIRNTVVAQRNKGQLTVSCGLALFPENGASFDALLRSAETSLQQARSQGGNCVVSSGQTLNNEKIVYL